MQNNCQFFDNSSGRLRRGLQRWSELPEPADFMSERGLNPPSMDKDAMDDIEINHRDNMLDNISIITIVEEWRSKWRLGTTNIVNYKKSIRN